MLKTITKESAFGKGSANSERAGNLEFHVAKIRGKEFLYFRIGSIVAQRSGLKVKDRVALQWDDETGYGAIKPSPKGWALQSGNIESSDPPLVLRVTRKKDDNPPYLEKLAQCQAVKASGNSLEFYFPDGTTFGDKRAEDVSAIYREHKEIVERGRSTRKDEPHKRIGNGAPKMKHGKPYGRRATDN